MTNTETDYVWLDKWVKIPASFLTQQATQQINTKEN